MNDPKSILEPIAGYLLDVTAKLRNHPFVPHSLTKLHNLKLCKDLTGARQVIEIGSFKGVTAKRLSYLFDQVITVEIDKALHAEAVARCARRKNIELLIGDGSDLLPQIAKRVDNAVLFLDGHFSGGSTGMGVEPEPVLKELDLVACNLENFSAVVVDDFRLFGVEPGWPSKWEVMKKIEDVLKTSNWNHYILNDQFVSIKISRL
jgi:SAM-dependent methyltransferase